VGQLTQLCGRILDATQPEELLAAALGAFCLALATAHEHQDPGDPLFTPFVMAAIHAAEGRDAVALAPSMPADASVPSGIAAAEKPRAERRPYSGADVAGMCMLLAARLQQLAVTAATPGDRQACADGAQSARTIHELLCGHAPA
jgi:hypothetical protein